VVEEHPESRGLVSPLQRLFTRRVLFLVGKGGVGKTTIATALALAASRRGKKTLLIELDRNARAARLLGLPLPNGHWEDPRAVSPTLFVLSISGEAALAEYLRIVVPAKRLLHMILESRLYQYFVAAAPGLKELLTMGKIWYEERKGEKDPSQSRWDLLIVDMPATGHSLQYLRMPQAARDTFGGGVIHHEAERIMKLFRDPEKTVVSLVTVPEELPVTETLETHEQLRTELCLPLGVLFINRVHPSTVSSAHCTQIRIDPHAGPGDRRIAQHVLTYAHTAALVRETQALHLQQLAALSLPSVRIPFCFAEEFGLPQVEQLSRLLEQP
jgi:anion-transporting  ArsA/GET3 family ATPase